MPKKMRVYYDTEFLEDGYTVDLISIGMHRDDGKEFYAVSMEFDTQRVSRNAWLMQNVMSSIEHHEITNYVNITGMPVKDLVITDPALMTRREIRDGVMEFCSDIWPEFWAWYGAYDHIALCQLFGRMLDLPDRFPMLTMDIKQLHKMAGLPDMPQQPAGKHNALEDARFNKVRFEYLQERCGTVEI
jgi:hypothetical protein